MVLPLGILSSAHDWLSPPTLWWQRKQYEAILRIPVGIRRVRRYLGWSVALRFDSFSHWGWGLGMSLAR
jgi:hypothetical protein